MLESSLKNARLLIVDDQASNIALLESILERDGYNNLTSITDSRQVIDVVEKFPPDLILLDLHMPHLDGYAVMEQIRHRVGRVPEEYLPILVLTADITPEAKLCALSMGARDFLTKPFDVAEVNLRIRNLLETRYLHLQQKNQNQLLEDRIRERTAELHQRMEDLALINELNNAINQGKDLQEIIVLMANELHRVLNCLGTTTCFPSRDHKFLRIQHMELASPLAGQIEKLAGASIWTLPLQIPMTGDGQVARVLQTGIPTAVNDPDTIKAVFTEFTENKLLKRLASPVYNILKIGSMLLIPLVSEKEIYGMLEMARTELTTESDLYRVQSIAGQLTTAIGRKRAQEALAEQSRFTSALVDTVPALVYVYDMDTNSNVYSNSGLVQILGYTAKQAKAIGPELFSHLIHPDDLAAVTAFQNTILTSVDQEVCEIEYRMHHADGTWVNIRSYESPFLRNKDGSVKQKIGIGIDISERKRAEETLRSSEARFRAVLENSNDGILFGDASATILYRSPSYCRINGFTDEERIGRSGFDTVHPEDLQIVNRYWTNLVEHPEISEKVEYRIRHKDGTWRWIETSGKNLLANPDVQSIVVASSDITGRKQAEQSILESEERFRVVVETANDAIITIDIQGKIVYWNRAAETIFGYSTEEAFAIPLSQIIPEQIRAQHRHGVEEAVANGERRISRKMVEAHGYTKDGREFPIEMSLTEWEAQAGHFFTAIIRDTTERKQRESELRAIARLSSALRTAETHSAMYPVICGQLFSMLQCDASSIEMINSMGNETVVEFSYGSWESIIGYHQSIETGFNGRIIKTKSVVQVTSCDEFSKLDNPDIVTEGLHDITGMPLIAHEQLIGVLWVGRKKVLDESEIRLLEAVADISANAIHRATLYERTLQSALDLTYAYDTTLEGWAHALELRDQETESHARNVVKMTVDLARAMGIGENEIPHVRRGALLHDIGKMGIPDSVLLKAGTLNEREWEIMQRHPEYGYKLLERIEYLHPVLDIPYCHHEKWDGTGYPRRLKAEEIPLVARIFAVVDVWDALCSDRPYRKAWTSEKARQYIINQSGLHFDPQVVQCFLRMLDA